MNFFISSYIFRFTHEELDELASACIVEEEDEEEDEEEEEEPEDAGRRW